MRFGLPTQSSESGWKGGRSYMNNNATAQAARRTDIVIETARRCAVTNGRSAEPARIQTRLAPGPARRRRAATGSRSMKRSE